MPNSNGRYPLPWHFPLQLHVLSYASHDGCGLYDLVADVGKLMFAGIKVLERETRDHGIRTQHPIQFNFVRIKCNAQLAWATLIFRGSAERKDQSRWVAFESPSEAKEYQSIREEGHLWKSEGRLQSDRSALSQLIYPVNAVRKGLLETCNWS